MDSVLIEGSFYPYRCPSIHSAWWERHTSATMDSKRHERSSKSNTDSPPAPPSPPMYSASYTTYDGYKNRMSSRRSPSPSDYRSSRTSRNDSPQDRRRRRRSASKSPPSRSHRRSRSPDRDKDRDRDRDRSRKYSRRDRSRSRSRGRSRSRDRRRSRSRNRSKDRHRGRESRRYHRAPSYESDIAEDNTETTISHPVVPPQSNAFKNDGSFMEMFKKMQEQMQPAQKPMTSVLEEKTVIPPPLMVGKRRGGRILKTGMVAKPKTEQTVEQPKDAWSLYMAEVKKYREVCCQEEDNTRPLVK